jgi:hypothetical protein
MTDFRRYFRLTSIALVAIVGVLTVVNDAAAGTREGNGKRGCCVQPVCSGCCCGPASMTARTDSTNASAVQTSTARRLLSPVTPCECRSSEQPASAPKPELAAKRSRSDRDPVGPVQGTLETLSCGLPMPVQFPICDGFFRAKSPLYLRTARLLI